MLQCDAVWFSVLYCFAVYSHRCPVASGLPRVFLRCTVLHCVAVNCCLAASWLAARTSILQCVVIGCSALQCVAVRCSVMQCDAVCYSVLQCVAVCYSGLQCVAVCCVWLVAGISMYKHGPVHICIYMHIHMYICIHIHTCTYIYIQVYIYIYMNNYIYIRVGRTMLEIHRGTPRWNIQYLAWYTPFFLKIWQSNSRGTVAAVGYRSLVSGTAGCRATFWQCVQDCSWTHCTRSLSHPLFRRYKDWRG